MHLRPWILHCRQVWASLWFPATLKWTEANTGSSRGHCVLSLEGVFGDGMLATWSEGCEDTEVIKKAVRAFNGSGRSLE